MRDKGSQFVSLFLLALLLFGGLFILNPLREGSKVAKEKVEERSNQLQILQSEFDVLNVLADEISLSSAKKETLLKAVPVGHKQDELLLELSKLTKEYNFSVNAINFAQSMDVNLGKVMTITSNFEGSYADLISFLQKLENAERLFQVRSISVQLTSSTDVVFNLNIEAYYQ